MRQIFTEVSSKFDILTVIEVPATLPRFLKRNYIFPSKFCCLRTYMKTYIIFEWIGTFGHWIKSNRQIKMQNCSRPSFNEYNHSELRPPRGNGPRNSGKWIRFKFYVYNSLLSTTWCHIKCEDESIALPQIFDFGFRFALWCYVFRWHNIPRNRQWFINFRWFVF